MITLSSSRALPICLVWLPILSTVSIRLSTCSSYPYIVMHHHTSIDISLHLLKLHCILRLLRSVYNRSISEQGTLIFAFQLVFNHLCAELSVSIQNFCGNISSTLHLLSSAKNKSKLKHLFRLTQILDDTLQLLQLTLKFR